MTHVFGEQGGTGFEIADAICGATEDARHGKPKVAAVVADHAQVLSREFVFTRIEVKTIAG
jgi:hypothetical protein